MDGMIATLTKQYALYHKIETAYFFKVGDSV
jgi:hypothetical protein